MDCGNAREKAAAFCMLGRLSLMKRDYKTAKALARKGLDAGSNGTVENQNLVVLQQEIKQFKARKVSKGMAKKIQEKFFERTLLSGTAKEEPPKWIKNMARYVRKEKHCAHCGNKDPRKPLMKCSACDVTRYCNAECQKEDWKNHKKICKLLRKS